MANQLILDQQKQLQAQKEEIGQLRAQLASLATELASLRERIGRSLRNSSKPPSSDDPGPLTPLSEDGDRACIWNAIHHAMTDTLLEGASVIDLKFKLFIAEIEQQLQNQHREEDQRINSLSHRVALTLLRVAFFKQWSK